MKPIRAFLAEAKWIDGDTINKGGYWLRVDGMPEIFVSEINGCFWMNEHRGLFKIDENAIPKFYAYIDQQAQRIREQKVTPKID